MSPQRLLLFGNVSQPPYCNNLFPPVRAFQKAFQTTVVEPQSFAEFVSTGGAKPALIPDAAVIDHTDPPPDIVVCLGGALHFSKHALRIFPRDTALAGFALSDPYGLPASIRIAPQFDLFYTQDPQVVGDYGALGIHARRCDPATDADLYRPIRAPVECDILYYGKWTPYRDALATALAARFRLRLHAYAAERRWSVPTLPPLETPDALRAALCGARLALETALLDDAGGKYKDTFHLTPRAFFAASCGVPSIVEEFPALSDCFETGVEIATFKTKEDLVSRAGNLLGDEEARSAMGRRARQRALREHTWDHRLQAFLLDLQHWRLNPRPLPPR